MNYQKHLDEVGRRGPAHRTPSTPSTGGTFPEGDQRWPARAKASLRKLDRRNDHEIELAFVIGKVARNVSKDDALDMSPLFHRARHHDSRPEERSFRKSADTYAILGPWLVTPDEIPSPTFST